MSIIAPYDVAETKKNEANSAAHAGQKSTMVVSVGTLGVDWFASGSWRNIFAVISGARISGTCTTPTRTQRRTLLQVFE